MVLLCFDSEKKDGKQQAERTAVWAVPMITLRKVSNAFVDASSLSRWESLEPGWPEGGRGRKLLRKTTLP